MLLDMVEGSWGAISFLAVTLAVLKVDTYH